jgi:hypothetical protein
MRRTVMVKSTKGRVAILILAALILTLAPMPEALAQTAPQAAPSATQVPQPDQNSVNWPGAGYGAAALVTNLVYIPCKMVYAILGSIVGGGTWLVTAGNSQASNTVFRSALGGDYVLTPQMLAGQQPIHFSGPTETPPPAPAVSNNTSAGSAANSSVQPIQPLPPTTVGASNSAPLDRGSGPAPGGNSIE